MSFYVYPTANFDQLLTPCPSPMLTYFMDDPLDGLKMCDNKNTRIRLFRVLVLTFLGAKLERERELCKKVNKRPIMFFSFPLSRQKILLNRKKRGKEKKLPERVEKVMCPSFSFCSLCYYVALCTNKDLALLTRWSTLWSLQNKHTGKNSFWNQKSNMFMIIFWNFYNIKTVQVNFVVNTEVIEYCVNYEIYLNSL